MFTSDQYELLDFGEGRKLERIGPCIIDRPALAAKELPRKHADRWPAADLHFARVEGKRGIWRPEGAFPEQWTVTHEQVTLELKANEFGHVGLFPEQAANWDWINEQLGRAGRPLKLLNLFAYTGGSTLCAAAAGSQVVHVDAARNVVAWARRNAAHSGLVEAPIRWITEDAARFVRRELKREQIYDGAILDPPSYGHGARRETWQIGRDLAPLLTGCLELCRGQPALLLITCHTPGYGPAELAEAVVESLPAAASWHLDGGHLRLTTAAGRELPGGAYVRYAR